MGTLQVSETTEREEETVVTWGNKGYPNGYHPSRTTVKDIPNYEMGADIIYKLNMNSTLNHSAKAEISNDGKEACNWGPMNRGMNHRETDLRLKDFHEIPVMVWPLELDHHGSRNIPEWDAGRMKNQG